MRIRAIKPDFFKNEELYDLERETGLPIRVAFAGLWCAADREGRFLWRPRRLKVGILPHDLVDFGQVLDALERAGLIRRYGPAGEYGEVINFLKHQKVNIREKDSELPAFTNSCPTKINSCPTKVDLKEGKGREGKGIKIPSESIREVFEHWQSRTGRKRSQLSPKRTSLIRKGIEVYGIEDCKRVVDGAMASSFHTGDNDQGKEYLDIELLFRDAQHIEQFIHYAHKPPKKTKRHMSDADRAIAEMEAADEWRKKRIRLIEAGGGQNGSDV